MILSVSPIRVTVWHEHYHDTHNPAVMELYPEGMHTVMKQAIEEQLGDTVSVRTALLEEPSHGLTDEVLQQTDVLTWWGHMKHGDVDDAIVDKVHRRVLEGMGLVVLHSGHYAKIFKRLMGTGCGLKWREDAELERLWCVNPAHPICDGLENEYFELPQTEMYGEFFDIPTPDELVFISWFEGGEVFRSGCVWTRGRGKVFYFRPGHETYPIYYDKNVRRVIANSVQYVTARPSHAPYSLDAPGTEPLSPISRGEVV